MRLIVQIPCYNEAVSLPKVIADIPRQIDGISEVCVLVVDDGSTDRTADVAAAAGADVVVRHRRNRGLASAFRTGLDLALRLGADIIVNTDGDGQYLGAEIPLLIAPIVAGQADFVVGNRRADELSHFSSKKRLLQRIGSWTVRYLSQTSVPDAPSGFRAFSREAALRLNVVSDYSYTLETLLQAGAQRFAVTDVPITARATPRVSRLSRSTPDYVIRSAVTLLRGYAMYQPLRTFVGIGALFFLAGLVGLIRFLVYYVSGAGSGHIQSIVLAGVLLMLGFQVALIGLAADLIGANRRLLSEALVRLRRLENATHPAEVDSSIVYCADDSTQFDLSSRRS